MARITLPLTHEDRTYLRDAVNKRRRVLTNKAGKPRPPRQQDQGDRKERS